MTDDYTLLLCDFKVSKTIEQKMFGRGTPNFRAPEIIYAGKTITPFYLDIYSLGIILFVLKTGILPYIENKKMQGYDMFELLQHDINHFWENHLKIQEIFIDFDKDFKELFQWMTVGIKGRRASINQVKESKWYRGPILTQIDLTTKMKQKLSLHKL